MCGVCGVVGFGPRVEADGDRFGHAVGAMVEALAHRGPDDEGIDRSRAAVLGATRLAIRGLCSGRQPIREEDSGVVVVCNGEIDNSAELREWLCSRGRTVPAATDVAVLPGLYEELGESFVEKLIGAFAIAVWDPNRECLLLARDRAGERPLFYTFDHGVVRFATEIAALATDRDLALSPDLAALACYLRLGSFTAPETPFAEIRKVAPAELVRFDAAGERHRRYWRWEIVTAHKEPPSIETFDRIFRRAVARQTEVEVDYGVFLSGGVDSSLVAAVARSVRPEHRLRAYTLRFDEASYDEGDFAGRVSRLLGCEQVPVWVRPDDIPEGIRELVRIVGEPLADPAWVPTALLARRAAQEVKVALVGEGADELFAGYPTYPGALLAERYARWPRPLRRAIARLAELWPPSDKKVTVSFLLKRFVAGAELRGLARHVLWTSNISPALLRRLGVEGPRPRKAEPPRREGDPREVEHLLDLVQRSDLETSLAEGLLTKADRASMQSALELRAPYLDRDVMEFAATLPPRERVRGITTKVFLKRAAERYLPREIVRRKKRGLSVPLSRWLRGPLSEWAEERLGDPLLAQAGVEPSSALAILQEHRMRKADHSRALWTLIVLTEWLRWSQERSGFPRAAGS